MEPVYTIYESISGHKHSITMATKAQKERVSKWVTKWREKLRMDAWSIRVEYLPKDEDYQRTDKTVVSSIAEIVVDKRYHEAVIKLTPKFFTRPTLYQESTILHELVHIIVDPVQDVLNTAVDKKIITGRRCDDLTEGLTEHITKIVMKNSVSRKDLNYHP